jgi:hypothetical protein
MANSDYVFLKGKTKWFRARTPDKYGKWAHVLYPVPESLEVIQNLQKEKDGVQGIKNVLKKDEDGYNLTIGRPTNKMIRGKVVGFEPPLVLEADGKTPLTNTLVGNGSDITTKVVVYTYPIATGGKGKAMRWESTRVDNLIPYEMRRDLTEDQEKMVRNLADQPPQPAF